VTEQTGQGSAPEGECLTKSAGKEFAEAEQRRATLENGQELAWLAALKSGLRNAVEWARVQSWRARLLGYFSNVGLSETKPEARRLNKRVKEAHRRENA